MNWNALDISLPLVNPVLKFFLILVIILFAPLILNRIRIPHLLGLIIAGAVIGPHGMNLIDRDSGIVMSGTAGLLYIMFLAGLEINLSDFRKHSGKSMVFGLYTFSIPMILGLLAGLYVLQFNWMTSVLLASMFASHTLIAYPILTRLGVGKNRAATVTIGGTMITDTLALIVLAVIVKMTMGTIGPAFWIALVVSMIVFAGVVLFIFPLIARWFFKRYDDGVSQYVFVLALVFLGAVLAELAGVEAIIGAFLAGLSLNRLIPQVSPLMNRIDFVGNALFIPFFLISVGMLIDYHAFFSDWSTLKVGAVMIIVATLAKFLAAWLTQKSFGFSRDERRIIFGLSNAQAAATLAAVTVGYGIILGTDAQGAPVRLLNENVLNGTILMILFTCTNASLIAQKGARNLALADTGSWDGRSGKTAERILVSLGNQQSIEGLIQLGLTLSQPKNKEGLYALCVIQHHNDQEAALGRARKLLGLAARAASSGEMKLHELLRYDINTGNAITSTIKEHHITDLILGLHLQKDITDSFLGDLTAEILQRSNVNTLIYRCVQPLSTIKRHLIFVPHSARNDAGFPLWLVKLWNIARNTRARLVFYAPSNILEIIKEVNTRHPVECEFQELHEGEDFLILLREFRADDNLIMIMDRHEKLAAHGLAGRKSVQLDKYFKTRNFILFYPVEVLQHRGMDFTNPTLIEPIDEIGRTLVRIFRKSRHNEEM